MVVYLIVITALLTSCTTGKLVNDDTAKLWGNIELSDFENDELEDYKVNGVIFRPSIIEPNPRSDSYKGFHNSV